MATDAEQSERGGRNRGRLAALALLVHVTCVPAAASMAESLSEHVDRLGAILHAAPSEDAIARLADLGPESAPAVWALLRGHVQIDPPLSLPDDAVLLRAGLERWPPSRTLEVLLESLTHERNASLQDRLVLADLIAHTDCDDAVKAILVVLHDVDRNQAKSRTFRASTERALVRLLRDRPQRVSLLYDLLPTVPPALVPSLVDAVSGLPHGDVVRVLSRAASLYPKFQPGILEELSRLDRFLAPSARRSAIDLARSRLSSNDPRLRRLAVAALGRLEDSESFLLLIDRLEDTDAGVQRAAHGALCAIARVERRQDRERWSQWFETEERWAEGIEDLGTTMESGEPFEALQALRELSQHPLFAERAAKALARGLGHWDRGIRQRTVGALERMDAPAAVAPLIEALMDMDDEVHGSAYRALVRFTGQDHGESWADWTTWWSR